MMNNSATSFDLYSTKHHGAQEIMNNPAGIKLQPHTPLDVERLFANIRLKQSIGPFTEDCICLNPVELSPILWQELAGVALECYNIDNNKNQGTELKAFGEVKSCVRFLRSNIAGFHLCFQAQDNLDSSPKNVFAEVFRSKEGRIVVNFCGVMDSSRPELLKDCRVCSKKKLHPNMDFFKTPPVEAFGDEPTSTRRHPLHYLWNR